MVKGETALKRINLINIPLVTHLKLYSSLKNAPLAKQVS